MNAILITVIFIALKEWQTVCSVDISNVAFGPGTHLRQNEIPDKGFNNRPRFQAPSGGKILVRTYRTKDFVLC